MTKKKMSQVEMLMAEAKSELMKENRKAYIGEIKSALKRKEQAEQLLRNIDNEILDLEIKIGEKLS